MPHVRVHPEAGDALIFWDYCPTELRYASYFDRSAIDAATLGVTVTCGGRPANRGLPFKFPVIHVIGQDRDGHINIRNSFCGGYLQQPYLTQVHRVQVLLEREE